MHHEMALAAIDAGKDVYCEKPLALNASQSREMADAAAKKGVRTLVGYNYPHHPGARDRQVADRGGANSAISCTRG